MTFPSQEYSETRLLLAGGYEFIVDARLYDELSQYTWGAKRRTQHHVYAFRYERRPVDAGTVSKYKAIMLHRHILGLPDGEVDHINGNTFDNRLVNLRVVTHQENCFNKHRRNGKKYKGVSRSGLIHGKYVPSSPFRVRIRVNDVLINLGWTATEEEGAALYNEAATKLFGEFAHLNVIAEKDSQ